MVFVLLACADPVDHPACLLDEVHGCGLQLVQACNNLFALGGLSVVFTGGSPTVYDARVTMDGVDTIFACGKDGVTASAGNVWSCDSTGFLVDGHGDVVEVEVDADGETWTGSFEPCWNASEPNGRCCGWNYTAEVELALD